jgi:hypothetical protein
LLQGTGGSNSGRKCSSHQSDKEHEKGVRAFTHRTLDQPLHYLFRRTCWAVGITIAITEPFLRQMHISSIKFVQTSLFACESVFSISGISRQGPLLCGRIKLSKMAPVVDLPLNPQVPHAISSLRVYPRSTFDCIEEKRLHFF